MRDHLMITSISIVWKESLNNGHSPTSYRSGVRQNTRFLSHLPELLTLLQMCIHEHAPTLENIGDQKQN